MAIVSHDPWVLRGRASALQQVAGIEVVQAVDHAEALTLGERWDEIDACLVDTYDEWQPFDRFPGVGVVEALRTRRGFAETRVVAVSPHLPNDFLLLRLAEAGADFLYGTREVDDIPALVEALFRPDADHCVERPPAERLTSMGLSPDMPDASVNAALAYLDNRGLRQALDTNMSMKSLPIGRRSLISARHRLARTAGMRSRPGGPEVPDWRRIIEFVNRARGCDMYGQSAD